MDTSRTEYRSRTENNHTEYSNSPSPSPYNSINNNNNNNLTANKHLSLNSAYSEPMPQSRINNHTKDISHDHDENIPPSINSSFQFNHNKQPKSLKTNMNPNRNHTHSNSMIDGLQYDDDRIFKEEEVTVNENMIKEEDDADNDSELDSEPEPSPTPIVSDLDDLLADSSNIYSNSNDSSISPLKSLNINISSSLPRPSPSFNSIDNEDEDSDTPEPLDTPQTPGTNTNFDNIPYPKNPNINNLNINVNVNFNEDDTKLDEEDMILSDLDEFNIDDIPPPSCRPTLRLSRSWQEKTMTNAIYASSQSIKCITPITQEMAEMKIKKFVNRRRSVANITPSVHKLFKLDPDLMRIREEYLQRSRSQNNDSDDDNDKKMEEKKSKTNQMKVDNQRHEHMMRKVDQTNNYDELNINNTNNDNCKTMP